MGLEERHGRPGYYYRKVRDGDRVYSEYVGNGRYAEMALTYDEIDRMERERERTEEREVREKFEVFDHKLSSLSRVNRDLVEAYFLANDYYKHKGQWRRCTSNTR